MKKREKAPEWVMGGMLLLVFIYTIIGFLSYMDLLPKEEIWIKIPNGSCQIFFDKTWWIGSILGLIFFSTVVTLSLRRKWNWMVTVGSLLLLLAVILGVIERVVIWRAYVYNFEWNLVIDRVCTIIMNIGEMSGYILLTWGILTSRTVQITVTIYLCLIYLIFLVPINWEFNINMYFFVGRPIIVIALLMIWFYESRVNESRLTQ